VAFGQQLRLQFPVVVDFAVEDQGQDPIGVGHGLAPMGQVQNAQPLMGQRRFPRRVDENAVLIGTPVVERPVHSLYDKGRIGDWIGADDAD
jgi:hypothetical protein